MRKKTLLIIAGVIGVVMVVFYMATRPTPASDGAFSPSPLALKLATSSVTNYENITYDNKYTGNKKVLMICTEERNMTMANGRKFSTGNHPVEMLLPMLHLQNAGFDIEVMTPTGEPVKIEMWAMPEEDEHVQSIYTAYKKQFEHPSSLADFVEKSMQDNEDYIAVYIPGGHGAMLGLPSNKNLNKLIHWSHARDLHMLAICHGPAALLAASIDENQEVFLYKGYKIAAFPDAVDEQTPMVGYMPGHMPWKFGERLSALGVEIINNEADETCHVDRKLITGASPSAANDFGKLAATELLKTVE